MTASVLIVLAALGALRPEAVEPSPLDSALVVPDRCGDAGPGLTVIVLHGYGTPLRELQRLRRAYARSHCTRLIFPRGAVRLRNARSAWWRAPPGGWSPTRAGWKSIDAGMQAARARVRTLLAEVRDRFGVNNGELVLAGFSQGATLAMAVALAEDDLGALVLCSGRFGGDAEWLRGLDELEVERTVVAHGRRDRVAPIWGAAELSERLFEAGVELHWLEYKGGHRPSRRADAMFHAALRETVQRAATLP